MLTLLAYQATKVCNYGDFFFNCLTLTVFYITLRKSPHLAKAITV